MLKREHPSESSDGFTGVTGHNGGIASLERFVRPNDPGIGHSKALTV